MTPSSKGVVFILDGLGDRPCDALEGKTPLEAAHTPCLDHLTAAGQSGMMDPLLPGLPVDTHTGVAILLGVPPGEAAMVSRGPIEAAGINLPIEHGNVLFRANLSTVEKENDHYQIIDRRAGRIRQNIEELCHSLQDIEVGENIYASLYPATQHRCVLQLKGSALSAEISDTDPGGKNSSARILQCIPHDSNDLAAHRTADAVNRFTEIAYETLSRHQINRQRVEQGKLPANSVIVRGVGLHQEFKNLLSHLNLKTAIIAGESTILGLANLFGFTSMNHKNFTALTDTDLTLKLQTAREALKSHDLVYVHIKGTDTAAHDKNPQLKSDFISRFDQALGDTDFDNAVIAVCADHSTDSLRGEHNGDAVPVMIYNAVGRRDRVVHFNETDCIYGSLNRLTAQSFLICVLDAMGKLKNFSIDGMEYFGYKKVSG